MGSDDDRTSRSGQIDETSHGCGGCQHACAVSSAGEADQELEVSGGEERLFGGVGVVLQLQEVSGNSKSAYDKS